MKNQLLGGRYCSIQEEPAALLKIRDKKTGELLSFYIARTNEQLINVSPEQGMSKRAKVKTWIEGSRFFALAGSYSD